MAYDDDDGSYRFRDFEDLAALLERYLAAPENLTVIRLIALTQAVHRISGGRSPERLDAQELARGLRERGLSTVPFDTVVKVADFVSRVDAKEDVLARVTLRDVQRIVAR
jgi:hypothetical protein